MGAAAICIVTMHFSLYDIDVFLIVDTAFPLNLSIIGQINRISSPKVKMATTTMLNFGYYAFSTPCMYSISKSQYPDNI